MCVCVCVCLCVFVRVSVYPCYLCCILYAHTDAESGDDEAKYRGVTAGNFLGGHFDACLVHLDDHESPGVAGVDQGGVSLCKHCPLITITAYVVLPIVAVFRGRVREKEMLGAITTTTLNSGFLLHRQSTICGTD